MTDQFSLSIPRDFLCPITREIMRNPVVLIDDVSTFKQLIGLSHISLRAIRMN